MNAFKQVISEVHPEDKESFEEMEIDKLVDYLELFFKCVVKQDGKSLNASSLQTYYCSLRRYFVEKRQLDIKTDMKFSRVSKVLARRQEESMKEGEIPGKHASKAIPKQVLVDAIAKGKFGLSNPRSLTANVIKAFTAGFGIRTRTEMYNIKNGDIKVGPLKANGLPEYIELGERITKTRRGKSGKGGQREYKPRIEGDDENPENCLLRPFLKMQAKKTPEMKASEMPLFLTCLNAENYENRDVWFTMQRMGINTVGTIVQKQIEAAGYDTKDLKISGTSVRKSMFDSLIQNDVPGVYASAHGGHSSWKSKESYVSPESASTKAINKILAKSLNGENPASFKEIYEKERNKIEAATREEPSTMGKEFSGEQIVSSSVDIQNVRRDFTSTSQLVDGKLPNQHMPATPQMPQNPYQMNPVYPQPTQFYPQVPQMQFFPQTPMWNTFYQQYPYCNQLPGQFNPYVPQFPMYQMPGFNQQMMMPMQPMTYGLWISSSSVYVECFTTILSTK